VQCVWASSYTRSRSRPTDPALPAFYSDSMFNGAVEKPMKALIAVLLALSGAVVATAAPQPDADLGTVLVPPVRPALPRIEQAGSIDYLNGGAGLAEADYMKSRAREFSLQLIFSGRGGEYGVADRVTVRRGAEDMLSIADAGPYLLMKLPPGRYTVEASFDGAIERRSVTIGSGTQRIDWNTPKASD
jgi:hypothetical protein